MPACTFSRPQVRECYSMLVDGVRRTIFVSENSPGNSGKRPSGSAALRAATQAARIRLLGAIFERVCAVDVENTSVAQLDGFLSNAKDLWGKFSLMHDSILENSTDDFLQDEYFTEDAYSRAFTLFGDITGQVAVLKDGIQHRDRERAGSPSLDTSVATGDRSYLPKIELPSFSGEYTQWIPFRDLFTSLVINNRALSDVERMHYLRASTTGEAAKLIASMAIEADSFSTAWETLTERYQNDRVLVTSHLDTLFKTAVIAPRSARDLHALVHSVTESYNSLRVLGAPIEHWDWVLVYLIARRLDPGTREAWELRTGQSKVPPSFTIGQPSATSGGGTTSQACAFCQEKHYIAVCSKFRQLSPEARRGEVQRLKLCFNCLGRHNVNACNIATRCKECGRKHHTMIHTGWSKYGDAAKGTGVPSTSGGQQANSGDAGASTSGARPAVLLATSQALLITNFGAAHRVRMLLDSGSELSLISDKLVQRLKLRRESSSISIIGIGGISSGHTRGMVSCTLRSINTTDSLLIKAFIIPKLMPTLPSFSISHPHWPHLQGIPLADPDFSVPDTVDLILGADAYGKLVRSQIRRGSPEEPIAQNTIFGWAIFGPCNEAHNSSGWVQHAAVDHGFQALQDLLAQFWVQEEVPVQFGSDLTPEEQECEAHFVATYSRDNSGRYIVRLPLRSSTIQLGQSFHTAHACLNRLVRKLDRDSHYKGLYDTFLGEYESLGHMSRVRDDEVGRDRVYYLPHHGVLTTKLRVVFNGSCNTDSGTSLNDLMHTGAKLQKDISDVLLWARRHRFIFATDIVKMFRQIRVHRDDWDLQRILWVDENGNTAHYHLTTVTYGTRSAPFLAVRVLLQLVADEGEKYPAAVAPLTMGRYVDDIYGGADQISELLTQARHLIGICTAGGFPLAKWQSNSPALLTNLGSTILSGSSHRWSFGQKSFYNGCGWKLAWDDPVSTEVGKSWVTFRHDLAHLGNIAVPWWLNITSDSTVEIHGFSDASQLAMGAVVYVRVTGPGKSTRTALVCSKTKVAPIKRLTIPRLELAAALLVAKLAKYVRDTLQLRDSRVYLWTDSTVTLTWVTSHPSRWKDFVRNRVSSIQELIPQGQWRFIPGRDNPADCASRGLTVSQLEQFQLWWNGPHWLVKSSSHWPAHFTGTADSAALEERPGLTLTVSTQPSPVFDLIHRYSSLTRLLRITSLLFKALTNLKGAGQDSSGSLLTPGDLEHSQQYWVKAIQGAYFATELKILSVGQTLPKSYPFTRLTAFIDFHGTIRVGGRLKLSALQPESKHSAILPRDSPLTRLLISDAHTCTLHGGTQATLAFLRQRYFLFTGVDYAGPVSLRSWRGRGHKTYKG
ncbi:uncharacterized protein [Venturia canescens]|uniref:uncharacterized protein n=1 Tax=Venturia canescens TaxID=32260 RepID=UPI001C9D32DE|nr:uncharacterized protein LOC122406332 [Venturia canescens]